MIEGVAEPDEARPDRAQVGGFQRERLEELLDLPDRFAGRLVCDGFAGEPTPTGIDGAVSDFQDRPPGCLERDRPSRLSDSRRETADGRRAAFAGDPNDEPREGIEPRITHQDARELENGAERSKR